MAKFTITHEINCNADTFWKVFFDRNFNENLYKESLGYVEFTITEQRETDSEIIRQALAKPKMDFPGPVAKLFGSGYRCTEVSRLAKSTKVWKVKLTPSTMADKIREEGSMRLEPIGDSKVRRIANIEIEAKIFGVGGLIESTMEKTRRAEWDQSASYMNAWIAAGNAG